MDRSAVFVHAHAGSFAGCPVLHACMWAPMWMVLQALGKVLPAVAQHKVDRGGFMILRPDSGDPTEAVLMALQVGLLHTAPVRSIPPHAADLRSLEWLSSWV